MIAKNDIKNFEKVIESLRQYQRYELVDDKNRNLLNSLYVDPLDNDTILNLTLKDNTTVLIGRKGTGKSTIFMRMQNELRTSDDIITCYIDVKDIFDKAKKSYTTIEYLGIKDVKQIKLYSIQRKFIIDFIKELISEIEKSYSKFFDRFIDKFGSSRSGSAIARLQEIGNRITDNKHLQEIELEMISELSVSENDKTSLNRGVSSGVEGGVSISPVGFVGSINAKASSDDTLMESTQNESRYNRVFARIFDITNIIDEVKDILTEIGIRKLFIVLDDYSEIDQSSLRMFCDLIVNTLNNNSDNFIKLKISAYPGRVELGELDLQKIDIRYLDYYRLYNYYKRDDMELAAIDYTKRIIENRLSVYTKKQFSYYFDTDRNSEDEFYALLFKMSLNVIRHLGLILDYAKDISISQSQRITITDLEDASSKFYQERLEMIFRENKLTNKTYNERIESFQLEELMKKIVFKSKEVKKSITTNVYTAKIFDSTRRNPFCSHFYVPTEYEDILSSLELNFFISKYNEMISKRKSKVSIYALNYGLCMLDNIRWGKPDGNEHRTYFIESPFNYENTIKEYFQESKKITCTNCDRNYDLDDLKMFEKYGYHCMACGGRDSIHIDQLSDAFDELMQVVEHKELIDPIHYKFLCELYYLKGKSTPKELGKEMDLTYQKVGWIAKSIREDYNFITRTRIDNYTYYEITMEGIDFINQE